jgi:ATP-binding cassette subfamily C (CFTR/MRP) protein 1
LGSLFASTLAALGLGILLFLQQQRSSNPSDLATLYLLGSLLGDVVYLTMPLKPSDESRIARPVILRSSIHLVLLVLESSVKHPKSIVVGKTKSPEELHTLLSRVLFTWINPILLRGYRNVLVSKDLPFLSWHIQPELMRSSILQTWSQRG